MVPKMFHVAMHCHHWTPGGVAGAAVPGVFSLGAIFFVVKISLMKFKWAKYSWGAVTSLYEQFPTENWMYRSHNGC